MSEQTLRRQWGGGHQAAPVCQPHWDCIKPRVWWLGHLVASVSGSGLSIFSSQAKSRGVEAARERLFSGEKINFTEVSWPGDGRLYIPSRASSFPLEFI